MKLLVLSFFLFVSLISCSSNSTKKHESNITIGKELNAHRYADIYFSGQPSNAEWKNLKEQGFTNIINLRSPKEYNEKLERKKIQAQGLHYSNIPFTGKSKLTDKYIDQVTKAVMKHRKEGKTLVHCSSGNRVGIWLAGHFHKDHELSKEDSLVMAKKLGLENEGAIQKAKAYFDQK